MTSLMPGTISQHVWWEHWVFTTAQALSHASNDWPILSAHQEKSVASNGTAYWMDRVMHRESCATSRCLPRPVIGREIGARRVGGKRSQVPGRRHEEVDFHLRSIITRQPRQPPVGKKSGANLGFSKPAVLDAVVAIHQHGVFRIRPKVLFGRISWRAFKTGTVDVHDIA